MKWLRGQLPLRVLGFDWLFTNPTDTQEQPETPNTEKTEYLGPSCLKMRGSWVLFPDCSPDEAEGGGRSKGGPHQAGRRPLGDSWERRRAKHQALEATQVLHLRNCKRCADSEKVKAQAKDNIRVFC